MKHFRWTVFIISIAIVVSGIFGCGKKKDPGKITIGFLLNGINPELQQRDEQYFTGAAKALGADVVRLTAEGTQESQNAQAEDLLNEGIDVLVVMPRNAKEAAAIVKSAHEKNIPVIAYGSPIIDGDLDMCVTFDNKKIGEIQTIGVVQTVSHGNFILMGGSVSEKGSAAIREGQLFAVNEHELLSGNKITILAEPFLEKGDSKEAQVKTSELLAKFKKEGKKVDAIIASSDEIASGVIEALKAEKLQGKVAVSGQDADLAACQRIVEGTQAVTIYKSPKRIAPAAAEAAVRLAKKESPDSIAKALNLPLNKLNNGTRDVPALFVEPTPVTGENILNVIVKERLYPMDKVYANVPKDQWPKKY